VAIMTKQTHTPGSGDNSLQDDLVTLVLGPLSDLIEKARLDILESLDIIARQMKRQMPLE
jgi:hypothetical protein